ncbi:MAG: PIN domain-containing protein, partial [Deltaproteobacteria bacterium]|nr:PIN domain-containing protein [Deltaproteobacteria bacterium]
MKLYKGIVKPNKKHKKFLDPTDAFHVKIAKKSGCAALVTDDQAFKEI